LPYNSHELTYTETGVEVDYWAEASGTTTDYCPAAPLAYYGSFEEALPGGYYGRTGESWAEPLMSPLTAYITLVWAPLGADWSLSGTTWVVAPDWATNVSPDPYRFPDYVWNEQAFAAYFVPQSIAPLPAKVAEWCTPLPQGHTAASVMNSGSTM
jgi:hypothetical protein